MSALLSEERKEDLWREYVATHIWYTARAAWDARGKELQTPNYSEIVHPELKDNRTAAQIKDDILQKFKG